MKKSTEKPALKNSRAPGAAVSHSRAKDTKPRSSRALESSAKDSHTKDTNMKKTGIKDAGSSASGAKGGEMKDLTPTQLRFLRAQAHHLNPVVRIGDAGLSAPVSKEIATALKAHELIKIKVMQDERVQREAMLQAICASLDAKAVQHIGKTLVIYRRGLEPKLSLPR